jgi:uncharacterized protein YbbC (DUF1343 family)
MGHAAGFRRPTAKDDRRVTERQFLRALIRVVRAKGYVGRTLVLVAFGVSVACASRTATSAPQRGASDRGQVLPGISVLLRDSMALLQGRRVGLITNQSGVNERGQSDIDLLQAAVAAHASRLVRLFSPEHGIRGTEDRQHIADARDEKTGLPIVSLYTTQAIPPPDTSLRDLDALVFDLFDIGTRTWTYAGTMLYAMRAAAQRGIPFILLDRPNPLGGRVEGPLLDSALANPESPRADRPGRAFALYPAPLRHGMTMGELARWWNAELGIGAELHVIAAAGWRRYMWWDETGLPWIRPSPNMPSLASALIYPALVAFEGTNVSVGRGTDLAFQRIGAPWMDAGRVSALLGQRGIPGVRFVAETFTPVNPTDGKFAGVRIPGVRIEVTQRDRVQVARVGAALVWALHRAHPDSLRVTDAAFDLRFGASTARVALLRGADPDEVIDAALPDVIRWEQRVRPYLLYR